MPLNPRFELVDGSISEIEELIAIGDLAFADDEFIQHVFLNIKPEDLHSWQLGLYSHLYAVPHIKFYKIVEVSTGKMVAFTALQFPWKHSPISDEQKAEALSDALPPPAIGMSLESLAEFVAIFNLSKKYGYDPENDYHRKGTNVLPEFQKMGLGTALTQHCNAISDATGDKTWVPARPSSVKMFRQQGFRDVVQVDGHFEKWGGTREGSITTLLVREAPK